MAPMVLANKNAKYKPIATTKVNFIEDSTHKNYGWAISKISIILACKHWASCMYDWQR